MIESASVRDGSWRQIAHHRMRDHNCVYLCNARKKLGIVPHEWKYYDIIELTPFETN